MPIKLALDMDIDGGSDDSPLVDVPFQLLIDTTKLATGASPNITTNKQFRLTLNNNVGGYSFRVDWGDTSYDIVTCGMGVAPVSVTSSQAPGASTALGTITLNSATHTGNTTPSLLHTYAASGTYTVSLSPTAAAGLPSICFADDSNTTATASDCLKVTQISQWGYNPWTTLQDAFKNCRNLTITATDSATAQTGAITNWGSTFESCVSLVTMPALNYTAATSMNFTWFRCSSLTTIAALTLPNVTSLSSTWRDCLALTSFPSGTTFPVCPTFNITWGGSFIIAGSTFPLLDFSAATTLTNTWQNCTGFASFPLINTANATTLSRCWSGDSGLTSFPLINTANVTNMFATWSGCSGLTSFPLINTAANISFLNTWAGCTGLTTFPVLNTAAGTDFGFCWQNNTSLTTFPSLNVAAGLSFQSAWMGCSGLTTFPGLTFTAATGLSTAWQNCTSMVTFTPTSFPNVTSASLAWNGCAAMTTIGPLTMPKCTNFNGAFSGCTVLNVLPITDPSFVTTFATTFSADTAFNQDPSGWNVEFATTMQTMFGTATAFKQSPGQWWARGLTGTTVAAFFTSLDINSPASPTQLVTQPQAFDNAAWTKTNLTAPANTTTAPDGTSTADSLTPSVTNSTDHSVKQTITVVNGSAYTIRVALKADEYTYGQLLVTGAITSDVYVNLSTGAIQSSTGTVSVTDIGSGWYCLEITGTASTTSLVMQIKAWDNATGTSFAGNAANNIFAWQGSVFASASVSTANYSNFLNGFAGMNNTGTPALTGVTALPTIVTGGSGYTAGDILLVSGGTNYYSKQVRVTVLTVDGSGAVLTIMLRRGDGNYITQPTNPVSVTGGTGTGFTMNLAWVTKASAIPSTKTFNAGTSKYSIKDIAAVNGRKQLLSTKTWTITDGGPI